LKFIKLFILPLCLTLLSELYAFSQDLPKSLRQKDIHINSDTIRIDTLSIVPGSIKLIDESGLQINPDNVFYDYAASVLIIKNNFQNYNGKSIKIEYRVLPINLTKPYQHKDTSLILKNFQLDKSQEVMVPIRKNFFEDDDKLSKNGSISRGFVVGNQRDLGTLSNFNLQLAGKLNDEVSILAAVSDNNMPIQPEGNTQQLQEFDKVSILMYTKNSGIELGDISLSKPEGFFLNLQKQTRGIRLYSNFMDKDQKKYSLKSSLTAGMAKGKYNRHKIEGIEGNQGPYKLLGNNSEIYIVILSGSEKVYIDGKLLTRGEKFDYIIDYNAAEIVFTTNMPITKDSRIIVEYEYAQQYYPRVQFLQTNSLKIKKSSFWLNFYLENDNKNDPLSENFTDKTKLFLSGLGDSINKAYAPNIHNVDFSNDKVLYKIKDSLVNGNMYDSIFVYSTNPDSARYQLGFTYIGENQGNYKPKINNANGKVYEWVAPVGGIMQGSYEPVNFYITPKKSLMANAGAIFHLNAYGQAGFELALSNFDVNSYSSFDKENDPGYALKFNITQGLLNSDTAKKQLLVFANFRLISKNFKPLENFYEPEFERDWNLSSTVVSWQEQYFDGGFSYFKKGLGFINGKAGYMLRENNYKGQNANLSGNLKQKGFQLESQLSYLSTTNSIYDTKYLKHKFVFSKHTKYFVLGIAEESEDNRWKFQNSGNLSLNSFKFTEYSAFIKEADSSVNKYFVNYKYRTDFSPLNGNFQELSSAQTAQAGLQLAKNKNFITKTIITYRNLSLIDTADQSNKRDEYLSGRQEVTIIAGKGAIMVTGFYETGSGLEIRKQYQFIEVPKGQGQYSWIDYNQNNIKELDEFEPAKFQDEANYIQVFVPTNDYIRVFTTNLNSGLSIQPERIWMKSSGFKGFLSRFSDQFAGNVIQKANHPDFIPDMNDNEDLITRNVMIRNNFSMKSKNRKLQLDYLLEANNSKNLLINGLDKRVVQNNSFKFRYKLYKNLTLYNTALSGFQSYNSEFFIWKNYHIQQKYDEISFELRAFESLLSNLSYRYVTKNNQSGEETCYLKQLKFSANQEMTVKVNLQAEISYVSAIYHGEINSPVAYEMLEGLKNGHNMLWSLSYNQKLSKVLFLTISYNGRYSEQNKTIHNGSMQLRANF
jgi:hypothetical protein